VRRLACEPTAERRFWSALWLKRFNDELTFAPSFGIFAVPPSLNRALALPGSMASLDQFGVGQQLLVERIDGDDSVVQRLFEMGLLEGEVVEILAYAPLGDPVEIRLRDYRLSLRRSEAARVIVSQAPKGMS
jgi:ferrous iron transport protein A